ncbi:gluconeogenesis factor YvcK family protein [Desulfatitalea alkaliphila]|uniref:Putative gluconeogenesis factor n=1 Tax=Desulfatitalea alkaliphila TaxID=2929485 RepID=A0AA41UPL5_9BACT|nr:gluconeogenesis factor YvcK family protein [Desulfatitalea alkaliphila]MCJ8500593.1 YvcK family protein [Desulfatitalea alkaliphila]
MDFEHSTTAPLQVVTIGGGSGQFALLSGLRDIPGIALTAVVSMMDSGGSTGRLRDELGTLPPGDVLKCIVALSPHQQFARQILQKRFKKDRRLEGHNAGNMLLTMLSRYTGNFPSGVAALSEILDTRGTILPVTTDQATLVAELTDGTRIFGEQAIDVPRGHQREKIRDVFLVPHHCDAIHVYPPVVDAIAAADFIIVGPGDLFTSIIPNLVVPGVADALRACRAPLLYVLNIMTKYGETHNFLAMDFVQRLEAYLGKRVDGVIYNNRPPSESICQLYQAQKADCVRLEPSDPDWTGRTMHAADLIETDGPVVRHDPRKLAGLLQTIFFAEKDPKEV